MNINAAVREMEAAVDLMWLRLAQCFAAFTVVFILMVATVELEFDQAFWAVIFLALLCLLPWLVQTVRVQRHIKRVEAINAAAQEAGNV